jgi:hypothetical protein
LSDTTYVIYLVLAMALSFVCLIVGAKCAEDNKSLGLIITWYAISIWSLLIATLTTLATKL